MINSVNIVGRITKDIQLRYSEKGTAVANFTVACNRPFKNSQGEREADFINVVQFQKGAELTAQYMSKGSQVGVSGRIQTRNYENKEGQRVFITEVVADQVAFLESKNKQENSQNQEKPNNDPFEKNGEPIDISDDDLPF
ncbi:single-strand DNA-binding protein [Virgibacillus natechei]|uniref:Single-stranded DNA-binding protein n=1 Tax=Virgibacillus natechei TaxID=1216297 RepID=A0ABS4IM20_9BACI|nr:single-stranded DNA-binding protein [Virgibacillus natechei]MBP1971615.1 single-strand DNA-binding protein [Virgibacillus natechei]UZD13057.1 single-stranded DNA-binding protein [Virgibacillus natechei]